MKQVQIDGTQYQEMVNILIKNPSEFLLSPHCRQFLAMSNFHKRGAKVTVFDGRAGGVMPGTIAHNRIQIDQGTYASLTRTARLIGPIMALDQPFQAAPKLKVLSIGPRTEMELYHLVGCGFLPENITAIDLISPSPWIDAGDMHAMPYPDGAFDISISSWVLGYSSTPHRAMDEMLRVTKNGGIIAVGCTHEPDWQNVDYNAEDKKIVGTMFKSAADLMTLVGRKLDIVHFQAEPAAGQKGAVMLVARIKH